MISFTLIEPLGYIPTNLCRQCRYKSYCKEYAVWSQILSVQQEYRPTSHLLSILRVTCITIRNNRNLRSSRNNGFLLHLFRAGDWKSIQGNAAFAYESLGLSVLVSVPIIYTHVYMKRPFHLSQYYFISRVRIHQPFLRMFFVLFSRSFSIISTIWM